MKERGILFSGAMVRAILEGRKTMTRRAVKFPTSVCKEWAVTGAQDAYDVTPQNDGVKWGFLVAGDMGYAEVACPYGVPGDRLWVRESNLYVSECGLWLCRKTGEDGIGYEVWSRDGSEHFVSDERIHTWDDWNKGMKELPKTVVSWSCTKYGQKKGAFTVGFCNNDTSKMISTTETHHTKEYEAVFRRRVPGIFMPRWASRITLEVTGVRVERLQEITEEDAVREGCKPDMRGEAFTVVCRGGGTFEVSSLYERGVPKVGETTPFGEVTHVEPIPGKVVLTAREAFRDLWWKINGRDSWDANPWVWVVEFKRVGIGD